MEPIQALHWRVSPNNCGQMMPDMWNMAGPSEVEYRQLIHQSSDQSNNSKEIEKQPCSEEIDGQ